MVDAVRGRETNQDSFSRPPLPATRRITQPETCDDRYESNPDCAARCMSRVHPCALPETALLQSYRQSGAYTDCYCLDFSGRVSHAEYAEAFYTTGLFKLERFVLALIGKPSSDAQARALARGESLSFAAWSVEARAGDQLLLCDFRRRTRSWLMCEALDAATTRLYFGSAVVPLRDPRSGRRTMGVVFRALLGFHRLYSRALLWSAARRLRRQAGDKLA